MERDDELKGSGNSYDFGARIYDSRLGRWFGVDKLDFKHTSLSPYTFVSNLPTRFIDYDGNDFGIIINHDTKTIVIVANYYTNKAVGSDVGSTRDRALKVAAFLKGVTANYLVPSTDGCNTLIYTITFDISVKQTSSRAEAEKKATEDPIGNSFITGKVGSNVYVDFNGNGIYESNEVAVGKVLEDDPFNPGKQREIIHEGMTRNKQYIYVGGMNGPSKNLYTTDVHEVIHTLTTIIDEWHSQPNTVMSSDENRKEHQDDDYNIPSGLHENILNVSGLLVEHQEHDWLKPVVEVMGSCIPDNFARGTVSNVVNNYSGEFNSYNKDSPETNHTLNSGGLNESDWKEITGTQNEIDLQ